MFLRDRHVRGKRGRVTSQTSQAIPIAPPDRSLAVDVTLSLPDDLLLVMGCGLAGSALAMEAVCGRYLSLLRGSPLWKHWALDQFPVLRSILSAISTERRRRAPDYRSLYRMHRDMEARRKVTQFEKVGLLYLGPMAPPSPPAALATSLDDYVLTVQIYSYDAVLASSSCPAAQPEARPRLGRGWAAVALGERQPLFPYGGYGGAPLALPPPPRPHRRTGRAHHVYVKAILTSSALA